MSNRMKYWTILLAAGFEPFGNTRCDWRRRGIIRGEVERVWISSIDGSFRAYGTEGFSVGHGKAPWELEALI